MTEECPTGEAQGGYPIQILERRIFFSNSDRIRGDPSSNEYRVKIEISSFSKNLDIDSFLDWVYEVEKFFDMTYILEENHIKFVVYKLKGGGAAW